MFLFETLRKNRERQESDLAFEGRITTKSEPLDPPCNLQLNHCIVWPTLVARDSQDVARTTLGEVRPRLVDLGLHDNRALPPIHAALDGTGDVDLQLPLLTAERTEDTSRSVGAHGALGLRTEIKHLQ